LPGLLTDGGVRAAAPDRAEERVTVTDQAATDQPATDQAATDQPATDHAATDQAATDQPATDQPATDQPATDQAATNRAGRPVVRCAVVTSAAAADDHHGIRHEVFVVEQAVFAGGDIDDRDAEATTIKVLGFCGEVAAGTVRLFPTSADATEWQGDRLAVLAPFRRHRVGAPLVDFAVRSAAERGGQRMTAHIQLPNVRFFEALGWHRAGPIETYVGIPHQPMAIDVRRRSGVVS
jgi:putative N-acetyltransferase (TIGR04045 family)